MRRSMAILSIVAVLALAAGLLYFTLKPQASGEGSASTSAGQEWQRGWNLRLAELKKVFGEEDDHILTAMPPFYLGGGADVLTFRKKLPGVAYVTAGVIGDDQSKPNAIGQYELMICLRKHDPWAPQLISQLARYTTEAVLEPNDTMDIAPSLPQPTELSNFLFLPYAKLTVDGKPAAVMLCLGITPDELQYIRDHNAEDLVAKLKAAKVYPFTDLARKSVLKK